MVLASTTLHFLFSSYSTNPLFSHQFQADLHRSSDLHLLHVFSDSIFYLILDLFSGHSFSEMPFKYRIWPVFQSNGIRRTSLNLFTVLWHTVPFRVQFAFKQNREEKLIGHFPFECEPQNS